MSGGEHTVALIALLYLPVAITALMMVLETGAKAGVPAAVRLRRVYMNSSPTARLAAVGMLVSAIIHLALVPSHWTEDPLRAVLFLLDGVALSAVAVAAVMLGIQAWRPAALVLLSAGIVSYACYVLAGVEEPDSVGVTAKLVELAVIGLVLVGSSRHVGSGGSRFRSRLLPKAIGGLFR
jgi:peptidoglycan/LPS O-acetylase OafA/YrhL